MNKYSVRLMKCILLISAFFQYIGSLAIVDLKPVNFFLSIVFCIFALVIFIVERIWQGL